MKSTPRVEDLCFGEVPDAHFGHDGNRDGFLNADDHQIAMRATPPAARMSAGTRSSAITATAPASRDFPARAS